MLDIVLFRVDQGGDPEVVRHSQTNRYKDVSTVDQVINLDTKWRSARHKGDLLNRVANVISKTVGEKKKAARGKNDTEAEARSVAPDLEALESHLTQYSYIYGYMPCQTDSMLAQRLSGAPAPDTHPAVCRWYTHITSFSPSDIKALPESHQLPFRASLAKEAEGTETKVPDEIKEKLTELTMELLRPLTVSQLKEVKKLVDEAMVENNEKLVTTETERDAVLKEIGNIV
ncbi:hypothetical protein OTU49_012867, partial [Cherax quadricarinatus]